VKLNVHERMIIIPLLPEEESFAGIGEIYRLKQILQLTPEEAEEVTIIETNKDGEPIARRLDNVKGAAHVREIPISEWMTKSIRKILSDKDKAKKLKENEQSIFEKFCLDYDQR